MDMIDDALAERIKDLNWPPIMEWRQFADWVRVDPGVVEGWVKRAYIPTNKIGRHRMVNIVRLLEQLEAEDL
ncbi:MAG: DNA-binding protein [Pseudomonadales bacterium]|nr:DNA-binding protein [Pseudomonadales bacterium]